MSIVFQRNKIFKKKIKKKKLFIKEASGWNSDENKYWFCFNIVPMRERLVLTNLQIIAVFSHTKNLSCVIMKHFWGKFHWFKQGKRNLYTVSQSFLQASDSLMSQEDKTFIK